MIFRRRATHKLPKFPSHVIPTFRKLCDLLPVENIPAYKDEITRVVKHMHELTTGNPHLNEEIADEIAKRCQLLLDLYPTLSDERRRLVVGALRYFVITDDALSETSFSSGLDDDAKVMNYVLQQCGVEDQFIRV